MRGLSGALADHMIVWDLYKKKDELLLITSAQDFGKWLYIINKSNLYKILNAKNHIACLLDIEFFIM